MIEALSIEDTEIETEDPAEEALELVHPALLMKQHLVIYLGFSKRESRDQMSSVGKSSFLRHRLLWNHAGRTFKARYSSIKMQC